MRRRVAVPGVITLRRRERPHAQIAGFCKSRRESYTCLLWRFVDLEHQHELVAGLANRRVENPITVVVDDGKRFPSLQIARSEHVYPIASLRAGHIDGVTMDERAAKLVAIGERRGQFARRRVTKTKVIRLPLIVPILLADALTHPLKTPKPAADHERRRLDQIEVDRAELADEWPPIGIERTAAVI
jgi:hypothetical protein